MVDMAGCFAPDNTQKSLCFFLSSPALWRPGLLWKRLLDEINPFFQDDVMGNEVCRIARHEQIFEVRMEGMHFFRQVPAVHHWHDHVGREEMDLAGMLSVRRMALPGLDTASAV
jgi:hypothetical protein